MAVSDAQLDQVVLGWKDYAEKSPSRIQVKDLLKKRDFAMYRGLGVTTAVDLATRMVQDRSVASLEMTMGWLYELLIMALGPSKIGNKQKTQPGYRGIDFTQETVMETRLVNLKAGLSTSNGDITSATIRNLVESRDFHRALQTSDDNPLRRDRREVVMIKAVAKGSSKRSVTSDGILWLVGDEMWAYFDAGSNFLARVLDAMGRNPLDFERLKSQLADAASRVEKYLYAENLASRNGNIAWAALLAKFP